MWIRLVILICLVGVLLWIAPRLAAHFEKERKQRDGQREQEKRELERQRTMLYQEMTVDEAQAIVWGWEEMTEEERAALALERRVEIRKIREDLAAHKKQWGLK